MEKSKLFMILDPLSLRQPRVFDGNGAFPPDLIDHSLQLPARHFIVSAAISGFKFAASLLSKFACMSRCARPHDARSICR